MPINVQIKQVIYLVPVGMRAMDLESGVTQSTSTVSENRLPASLMRYSKHNV
jgi:hypothetical protein